MPSWIIFTFIIFQIYTTIANAGCKPDSCPLKCCDSNNECARSESDCEIMSCAAYCPSKCCTGGVCQPTNSSCRSQNTLILVLIGLAVLACIVLIIVSYARRSRLRRLQASRRAAMAQQQQQQQHHQQQQQQQPQNNGFANNLMNLFPMIPLYPVEQVDYRLEKGEPFREGAMKKAYELPLSKIEYGLVLEPGLLEEEQRNIAENNDHNKDQSSNKDNKDIDDADNEDEKLSIGNMLRSDGEESD